MIRSRAGFTKVELLVCLGICSVLGASGSSAWFRVLPDLRLGSTVREMTAVIHAARIRAVRENADVAVTVSRGDRFEAFVDNGAGPEGCAGNGKREAGERLICTRMFPPDVQLHKVTFPRGTLRFHSRGRPRRPGSFYFRNRKGSYLGLSVSIVGGLRIKESTDGGKTWKRR
jgi:Tfp pilus assembly protein FimT